MRIIDADGHVLERDIKWADLLERTLSFTRAENGQGQSRI